MILNKKFIGTSSNLVSRSLSLIFVLELLNYYLTTMHFNTVSTMLDILIAAILIITELCFFEKKTLSLHIVIIFALLLIKIVFTENPFQSLLRVSSFFIQTILIFELPKNNLSLSGDTTESFVQISVISLYRVCLIVSLLNVALMAYGKFTGTYAINGIEIGNYISDRFNGLFNTPAFCGEATLILLYFGFLITGKHILIRRVVCLVLVVASLYLCSARTECFAIVVFIYTYLLLSMKPTTKFISKALTIFIGGIVVIAVLFLVNFETLDTISSYRLQIWKSVLTNCLNLSQILGNQNFDTAVVMGTSVYNGGTHNAYIQLIYNVGIIITIIILSYILKSIKPVKNNLNIYRNNAYKVIFCSLISALAFGCFESHLFFLRSPLCFAFWFMLLIGNLQFDDEILKQI